MPVKPSPHPTPIKDFSFLLTLVEGGLSLFPTHTILYPAVSVNLRERIFHILYEAGDALVPSTVSVHSRCLVDAAQISE